MGEMGPFIHCWWECSFVYNFGELVIKLKTNISIPFVLDNKKLKSVNSYLNQDLVEKRVWEDRQQIVNGGYPWEKFHFLRYILLHSLNLQTSIYYYYFLQKGKRSPEQRPWMCADQLCSGVLTPWPTVPGGRWPLPACCFAVHYQLLKQQVPGGWSAGTCFWKTNRKDAAVSGLTDRKII